MTTFFWADVKWRTVVGVVVLISLLITFAWWLTSKTDPPKPLDTESYLEMKLRTDSLQDVKEKQRFDSLSRQNRELVRIIEENQDVVDSNIFDFYNNKTKQYDEKINSLNRANDRELFDFWTRRYGK